MNDNNRPLIMVVDDETKIRRLIATNLERSGFDVMSAADGLLAVEIFMKSSPRPDLILLDVMMPGMDGLECAAKIRDIDAVPIIFITAKSDGTTKLRGFDLGADDYVTKPFSIEELIARIRAVLRRSQAAAKPDEPETQIENGPLTLRLDARTFVANGHEVHLTATEFGLLEILMHRPGAIFSHEELLHKVWGAGKTSEVQYLRVAFTKLRRKFEEAGLEGGIISAYSSHGYVLRDMREDALEYL